MPKVSRTHQEKRRQQIIEAASRCFLRKGFHQTSMQDIVAESGLSPGAIYLYFKSKNEIIRAAADRRHESERALFAQTFADRDAHLAFSEIARHFVRSLLDNRVRLERKMEVQLWGEAMVNPEVMEVVGGGFQETLQVFTGILSEYRQSGAGTKDPPEAAARVMLALFQGFVLQMQLNGSLDVEPFMDAVQSLIDVYFAKAPDTPENQSDRKVNHSADI